MKRLAEKRWARVLAAVLFLVFLLVSCAASVLVTYGRNDWWYNNGTNTGFENTSSCLYYVSNGIYYVADNTVWFRDLTRTDLGRYAGRAFSYVIRDANSNITADTRTDQSVYVASTERALPEPVLEESAAADSADTAGAARKDTEDHSTEQITVEGYINLPVAPYDGCYSEYVMYTLFFGARYLILALKYMCLLLAGLCLFILCIGAFRRGRERQLRRFMKLPFDLVLAGVFIAAVCLFVLRSEVIRQLLKLYQTYSGAFLDNLLWPMAVGLGYMIVTLSLSAVLLYMSGQLGEGILFQNLLTAKLLRRIPQWVFLLAVLLVHVMLLVIAFGTEEEILQALLLLFDALCFVLLLLYNRQANRVRQAAEALANGDLNYKTDTKKLHFLWRRMGVELNSIGDGMAQAVEDRMRSERMKTELITNVSHDLKTPLTSIINYIDFLKADNLDEETRREYLAVLEKQSLRLKKLTEDVVEASKAASGALTVKSEPISMRELLEQFLGEYTGRFEAADIQPVLTAPEGETIIYADSLLLGRVIDNLVTNVLKYAQPGTRAYFDLVAGEKSICLTVKNTSREQLNISTDELMERFVRGDSSRHTEGSGLGLAIARSLTELMGGSLGLVLDGDLFKANVEFPILRDTDTSE